MNGRTQLIVLFSAVATATAVVVVAYRKPAAPASSLPTGVINTPVPSAGPSPSELILPQTAISSPADSTQSSNAVQKQSATPINPPTKKSRRAEVAQATPTNVGNMVTPQPPAQASPGKGKQIVAPEAREALSYVGTDANAEAVWLNAINDPTIPANERKDLIEDLNEDGFPDPHHITADDLPLVMTRIAMIEQIAPNAMDDTNAAAFAEAYKDLTNMLNDPNPK